MANAAKKIHNLNSFSDNDIYDEWIKPNIRFSALNVYLQNVVRTESTIQYNVMIYYGDRLLQDCSNRNAIFDDGVNIILTMLESLPDDISYDTPVQFTPFEQQFADQLAGIYCTVNFEVPYEIGKCGLELI